MSSLVLTILAAAVVMGLVIAGLSIGLILTGKSRLKKRCGQTPEDKKKGQGCTLCGGKPKCDPEPCDPDDLDDENHEHDTTQKH